jgi:hypothetical protein
MAEWIIHSQCRCHIYRPELPDDDHAGGMQWPSPSSPNGGGRRLASKRSAAHNEVIGESATRFDMSQKSISAYNSETIIQNPISQMT